MTYSIVARDPQTGFFGIAVASRFFAVGALVPHIKAGVGAVATQATVNPLYGIDGLRLLEAGNSADAVTELLVAPDFRRDQRQFHLIDAQGRNSAYTGASCIGWAGHLVARNVSVAGNVLTGPQVVAEALRTYEASAGQPMIARLLGALQAGEDAGGDKRGKQSAALLVFRDQEYPYLDIRVDDHADPIRELRRLYAVAQERYLFLVETLATRASARGTMSRREVDQRIAALDAERFSKGVSSSSLSGSFARPGQQAGNSSTLQ